MPFGKYKGCEVADLPKPYLEWLYQNVELRGRLEAEIARALWGPSYHDDTPAIIEPGKVKLIYRELALKWHPDRGGSTQAMAALNEFYEMLQEDQI
jgi:hypothetical protein